jgi:hypothetical protein
MIFLKQAFALLDGFSTLRVRDQRKRIKKIDVLLKRAKSEQSSATLAIRQLDQIQKQRAYMLIASGRAEDGIKEILSLVQDYEKSILILHDEASFQLCEAAIASFQRNESEIGGNYARLALKHAGLANRTSQKLIETLKLLQQHQSKLNSRVKK